MANKKLVELDEFCELSNANNFCERMQSAYWILANALLVRKEEVEIPLREGEELWEVARALRFDHPEINLIWNYPETRYRIIRKPTGKKCMHLFLEYNGTAQTLKNKLKKIEDVVQEIIENSVAGKVMGDEQRIEAIYKYMASRYRYSDRMKNGEYPKTSYNLECLLKQDAVCSGLSSAFTYILKKLQIPVMTVLGESEQEKHAWNIVQFPNGSYRHIDLTWDVGNRRFEYLALDDIAIRARRHHWVGRDYPICAC